MNEKFFLTVIGRNEMGVIADISSILLSWRVSIADISQKIIESNFVLFMVLEAPVGLNIQDLQKQIEDGCSHHQMKVMLAHENLFNSMHRI